MYPVSTALLGSGNIRDSFKTPVGKHRIFKCIGNDMPAFTIFRGRKACGIYNPSHHSTDKDWILSRILWLEGMQTEINRRGRVDTKSRYIYIHGTHDEESIGKPASHGCIRMKNADILDLFKHVQRYETVMIR